MKKVLYSDLDGTLFNYNNKGSFISEGNKESINDFTKNSYFGIATGRNLDSIRKYFENNLEININLPFVLMNGSYVYDLKDNKEIFKDKLNKEVIYEAVNYINQKDIGFLLLIGPTKRYHIGKYNEEKYGKLSYEVIETNFDDLDFSDVSKMNFVINEKYYEEILNDINKFKSFDKIDLIPASKRYVEIVNKGTSKSDGIKRALKYKKINDYKLYAIGDFTNDYLMLKNADVSFVPSNGHEKLKEIATYVVKDHKEDAVKEAIEIINK